LADLPNNEIVSVLIKIKEFLCVGKDVGAGFKVLVAVVVVLEYNAM
jgi:hypothetical protein